MAESPSTPELLGALGRLARGLSVLFWGLPIALVVCVQSAKGEWFRPLGVVPPLIATGLLFYGLNLLGVFQPQERVWRNGRWNGLKVLALINAGASPFLYWWNRIPSHPFLNTVIELLMLSGLLFLLLLQSDARPAHLDAAPRNSAHGDAAVHHVEPLHLAGDFCWR